MSTRHARAFVVLLAVVGAGLLSGCTVTTERRIDLSLSSDASATAVDVLNRRGSVTVRVDPDVETPRLSAEIVWADGVSKKEARSLDETVTIDAEVREQDGREVVWVRIGTTRGGATDHRVRLTLLLPRVDGSRVISTDGDVVLVGVGGATHVETDGGAIEVRTNRVMRQPVALIASEGNVYYQAPGGSTGIYDLETAGGGRVSFSSRIDYLRDMKTTKLKLVGALGDRTNPVTLRSGDGSVRAWIMEDPMSLVRAAFMR